jgi:hypothetical protein
LAGTQEARSHSKSTHRQALCKNERCAGIAAIKREALQLVRWNYLIDNSSAVQKRLPHEDSRNDEQQPTQLLLAVFHVLCGRIQLEDAARM